jgi:hypothetical protein
VHVRLARKPGAGKGDLPKTIQTQLNNCYAGDPERSQMTHGSTPGPEPQKCGRRRGPEWHQAITYIALRLAVNAARPLVRGVMRKIQLARSVVGMAKAARIPSIQKHIITKLEASRGSVTSRNGPLPEAAAICCANGVFKNKITMAKPIPAKNETITRCWRLRNSVRILNCTTAVSSGLPNRGKPIDPRERGAMSGSSTVLWRVRMEEIRNEAAARRGVSIRPFEAASGRGCPALRGTLCRDIRPGQAIPPQQRCFCALPERIGHAAGRGPFIDKRKENAFFLHKDVAAQIQIPSRRMLREHAQRRTEAVRKQRWAKDREARETALGKPIRRVRVKHR